MNGTIETNYLNPGLCCFSQQLSTEQGFVPTHPHTRFVPTYLKSKIRYQFQLGRGRDAYAKEHSPEGMQQELEINYGGGCRAKEKILISNVFPIDVGRQFGVIRNF